MKTEFEFAAVVLAGGRSTRMGRDKAFLKFNGSRLIDRQIRLVKAAGAIQVTVSGRRGIDYRVGQVPVRLDRTAGMGPSGGLLTALVECHCPFLLALAVDLPLVDLSVLRALLGRVRTGRGVVPVSANGWEPLAAVYPQSVLPLWRSLAGQGGRRAQQFVEVGHAAGLLDAWRIPKRMERLFLNWNYPTDLVVAAASGCGGGCHCGG